MRRLVVVSNRTPSQGPPAAGGVAVALNDILKEQGGLWFGWSGAIKQSRSRTPHRTEREGIAFATVDLTEADHASYYEGYANRVLWPAFHQRLDLADFAGGYFPGYQSVNRYFAARLAPLLDSGDLVWIHDYHLIPLAAQLRRKDVGAALGFFLHIPVPPSQVMAALPEHRELFDALCAHDLVGFQTVRDQKNFLDYAEDEMGLRVDRASGSITLRERTLRTGAFPIGTDPDAFARIAADESSSAEAGSLPAGSGIELAIGVDRLDYTKGLVHRVRAFEHFLNAAPQYRRRVSLLQIAPPSRQSIPEYAEIGRALDTVCGNVNGTFGEFDWHPVRYLCKPLPQAQLAGLYRSARVGLVTSLCDGMNLVAKEFVASQDPIDPGVLVLSRFAGAAEQMDDALVVNPHNIAEMSDAIGKAFGMPRADRRARWVNLMSGLRDNTVFDWRDRFIEALGNARGIDDQPAPQHRLPARPDSSVDWQA